MNMDANVYACKRWSEQEGWDSHEWVQLSDTVSGEASAERTRVRCGWTAEALLIQFLCEDTHIVSDYTQKDEPLYNQDVVEVFIDERCIGTGYIELEVSPHNVVFDARIGNEDNRAVNIDLGWNIEGLQTSVNRIESGELLYEIRIPAAGNFETKLEEGIRWKVNFYRIDESVEGVREYQAWQPTGAVQFHMPGKFGTLLFV
ncbi:carbohydrate binding protein with CBM9 domain [Paenibacillus taihuensis]|uniref:Carbohydrate binding protein with CBM9 domain n=1 Tax=Paenibacillus taihuensis TaxID=1156355 RepID=A0A3D9QUV3_9BACL|nr:carbohydrate-binding family 9-like protein [Paenibacillus taihuensis]REE68020.1 carbohydrate binding protein with CBM9 domain [Paenibacillus taihuensis]